MAIADVIQNNIIVSHRMHFYSAELSATVFTCSHRPAHGAQLRNFPWNCMKWSEMWVSKAISMTDCWKYNSVMRFSFLHNDLVQRIHLFFGFFFANILSAINSFADVIALEKQKKKKITPKLYFGHTASCNWVARSHSALTAASSVSHRDFMCINYHATHKQKPTGAAVPRCERHTQHFSIRFLISTYSL